MTEDEALKCWCPHVRHGRTNVSPGTNRWQDSGAEQISVTSNTCLASACMAWRWRREKETAAYLADVQAHMQETGDNFNKATQKVWADKAGSYTRNEGFCGLAGMPS